MLKQQKGVLLIKTGVIAELKGAVLTSTWGAGCGMGGGVVGWGHRMCEPPPAETTAFLGLVMRKRWRC